MRKFLFVLAALMVSVASLLAGPKESAVRVSRQIGDISHLGSGTVIASEDGHSLIMTGAHVVEDGSGKLSVTHGEKVYPAKRIAGSKVRHVGWNEIDVDGPDLAILEVAAELPAVTIAATFSKYGETVSVWGFAGGTLREYPGEITPTEWPDAMALATRSLEGNSGAGVFNKRGELVGVQWGGDRTTLTVRLDFVAAFTASVCESRPALFPRFRKSVGAVAAAVAAAVAPGERLVVPTPTQVPTAPASPKEPTAAPLPQALAPSQCANGQCSTGRAPARQRGVFLNLGIFRR